MDTTFLQQAFSDSQVLTVPWSIDYFSVVVGVLTGALFACDRKLDIIGTVVLGLVTGYGGGIIRDMLLQTHGVYFTSHPDLILICIAICAFVFYFRGLFRHLDAGAVRDICVGETPGIFQQSNFYAVAGLGGSFAFVALAYAGSPLPLAGVACVFVVVFLRYWSVYFDWKTSNEADLTPHVARGVGKVRRVVSGVFLHGGDATVAQKERRRRGRWRRNHEKRD